MSGSRRLDPGGYERGTAAINKPVEKLMPSQRFKRGIRQLLALELLISTDHGETESLAGSVRNTIKPR